MTNLPTLKDFSKESISKAVFSEAATHPGSLYPGVLTVLLGVSGALFSSPLLIGASAGMLLMGAGSFVVNYCFRYDTIGKKYIQSLSDSMLSHKEDLIDSIQADLSECETETDRCEQGIEQFHSAEEKYTEVKDVLSRKLGGGELMYGRFMGSIEQVYLGILDNLREMVTLIKSLPEAEGDEAKLKKDLEKVRDENKKRQISALLKRFDLRNTQLNKIDELLARNEEAITQLEETSVAVSSMKTEERFSDVDHEEAIQQLKDMAKRISALYDSGDNLKV
jgi:DNA repair exonuclease SbcCD ATPase subunit